jgi:hypothetical protein
MTSLYFARSGNRALNEFIAVAVNGSYVAQEVHVSGCCETF